MEERTASGYVFRTDLRLRPDPGATPLAVGVAAAEVYYGSMAQTWERAAMIKARPVAGDPVAGAAFAGFLRQFVWRRDLDFAAIDDIRAIKRQIERHRGHRTIAVNGHDIKLGRGGIREIEFFVQTQQLIFGGRNPQLRQARTVDALAALDPGGLEVLEADAAGFAAVLCRTNHTCKRALTDPRLFSGIGNAYSDEILHRARLSPAALTQSLDDPHIARLHAAVRDVLTEWRDRLVGEAENRFPEKVTAFRPEMAVHGRYGKPCPACGTAVQRIKYASNECNYCPRCQTGGRLLADRYFSTLLGKDWPRSIEALERTGAGA